MELLEMYCDLLLARFGLVQQMKTLDDGLAEAISSLIWVAPRLQADVAELKIIAEQLGVKYGKPYTAACRDNAIGTVAPKLMHKLSVQAPPKILVEKYLIEIAKNYSVEYEPDPQVQFFFNLFQGQLLLQINILIANLQFSGLACCCCSRRSPFNRLQCFRGRENGRGSNVTGTRLGRSYKSATIDAQSSYCASNISQLRPNG